MVEAEISVKCVAKINNIIIHRHDPTCHSNVDFSHIVI